MPMTPATQELNYLHVCENNPINGRYITLQRSAGTVETINIADVYVWTEAQPEDFSDRHGRKYCFMLAHKLINLEELALVLQSLKSNKVEFAWLVLG